MRPIILLRTDCDEAQANELATVSVVHVFYVWRFGSPVPTLSNSGSTSPITAFIYLRNYYHFVCTRAFVYGRVCVWVPTCRRMSLHHIVSVCCFSVAFVHKTKLLSARLQPWNVPNSVVAALISAPNPPSASRHTRLSHCRRLNLFACRTLFMFV